MSWGSTFLVGIVTAVVGMFASGAVAGLAIKWYRISSFEAGSAAFAIGLALLGLVAGFVIGVVTSRVVAAGGAPSFLRALGIAQGVLLGLVAVAGVSARLLADVPPTIAGQELMLVVEVRWPDGHAIPPATIPGEPFIRLRSVTRGSRMLRKSSRGPFWTGDGRLVSGRWVAPGAVDIFTSRGRFVLDVVLDDSTSHGFLTPLSGHPGRKDLEWTEWYPRARPGAPPPPNGLTYRYRVQPRTQPVRTDTVGAFEVATVAYYFFDEQIGGKTALAASSEFTLKHRGEPLVLDARTSLGDSTTTRLTTADAVAAVVGAQPALVVHFTDRGRGGACYLLADNESGRLRADLVPNCSSPSEARALTSDTAVFRAGRARREPRGWVDRSTFATPGIFLVGNAALDTRRLAVRIVDAPADVSLVPDVPPLSVSPDERSFVRFAHTEYPESSPVLVVTDVVANRSYTVPIDSARMRYATLDVLDPAWVAHHFAWERGRDGVDRLVERKGSFPSRITGSS